MRSILVGEVRTGRRITQIPVADASWSMAHRGPGDITVSIPLDASDFATLERTWMGGLYPGAGVFPGVGTFPEEATPLWSPGDGMRPELLAALDPGRCFLAVLEDETVLEAGPIWAWDYTHGGMLQVKATGMWSLFDHRFVMAAIASGFPSWEVTYTGLSLGTIAKRLVQIALSQVGGDLPIVLPADVAGTHERTYRGHELGTVRERLEQIMGVEGGPDIAFEPRLTEDRLGVEWVMRVGDPLLSQQGDDHVWDARVPHSGVGGLSVQRDAGELAQRAWATGAGMDESLLMARSTDVALLDAGFPLMETSVQRSTVEHQPTLQSWAEATRRAKARPWQTWTADIAADAPGVPRLGSYRPGDWARVWVPSDHALLGALLPEGFHRARVMSVSGGLGEMVRVTWAPGMEAR